MLHWLLQHGRVTFTINELLFKNIWFSEKTVIIKENVQPLFCWPNIGAFSNVKNKREATFGTGSVWGFQIEWNRHLFLGHDAADLIHNLRDTAWNMTILEFTSILHFGMRIKMSIWSSFTYCGRFSGLTWLVVGIWNTSVRRNADVWTTGCVQTAWVRGSGRSTRCSVDGTPRDITCSTCAV